MMRGCNYTNANMKLEPLLVGLPQTRYAEHDWNKLNHVFPVVWHNLHLPSIGHHHEFHGAFVLK